MLSRLSKKTKRILAVLLILCLTVGTGIRIWSVYSRWPNPPEIVTKIAEPIDYCGLTVTPDKVEVMTWEEAVAAYPVIIEDYPDGMTLDEIQMMQEYNGPTTQIFVTLTVINPTEQEITLPKGYSIAYWVYENDFEFNGADYITFLALNPDYTGTFEAGESQTVILPFSILLEYKSKAEVLSAASRLNLSYYPDNQYILFETEDYIHED
jgi:hypothetical protein